MRSNANPNDRTRATGASHMTSHVASPAAPDLGRLFRDLRRCLKLSIPGAAQAVGARVDVIEALEAGDWGRLPSWPETVRIITAYTALAHIDPRPVLEVMSDELAQWRRSGRLALQEANRPSRLAQRITREAAGRIASDMRSGVGAAWSGLQYLATGSPFARAIRWPISAARGTTHSTRLALACAVLAALLTSLFQSPMLQASATGTAIGRVIGTVQEYMLVHGSVKKDGMIWIDVENPRERRSDKLRVPQQ
jgi:hypothetical protein